jgi:hypothetical protein
MKEGMMLSRRFLDFYGIKPVGTQPFYDVYQTGIESIFSDNFEKYSG